MADTDSTDVRTFWIAIKPSMQSPVEIFGPFTESEANANLQKWVQSYPASAKISAVFQSASRVQAEFNARFYLQRTP